MDDNTRRLDETVKSIKANEDVGKRYMKSWERERILREEAIAEERANTERERKRADKAEQELNEARALIAELKKSRLSGRGSETETE